MDILAKDAEDRLVIIENELEATNHDHLGKIITYAAVHKAEIVIWLVAEVREEREQAITWLNDNLGEDIGLFLLEVRAVKIDNSLRAPIFDVVASPNEFVKIQRSAAGSSSGKSELNNL